MGYYIFADADTAWDAQSEIHQLAVTRRDARLPHRGCLRYAEPVIHPDGRAAIPADAGGVPTEQYRTSGAVALPEPETLDESWYPEA